MTQPVQEPSQGRTDAGQEFRTRQLFRRPAPAAATGGGEPSYAYVSFDSTPQTVAGGGSHRIAWEAFETNALVGRDTNEVFNTGGATTPGHDTAGDLYLHYHGAGYYLGYADVYWDNATYNRFFFVDATPNGFNTSETTAGMTYAQKVVAQTPLQNLTFHHLVSQDTLTNHPTDCQRASIIAYNLDAAARDVVSATLAVVFWPMTNSFFDTPNTDFVY